MRAEPSEEVDGRRLVDEAAKDDPGVGGVVAGIFGLTTHVQHDRRDRRCRWHRRSGRRGHDGRRGRRRPLSVVRSWPRTTAGAKRKGSKPDESSFTLCETTDQRAGKKVRDGDRRTNTPHPSEAARKTITQHPYPAGTHHFHHHYPMVHSKATKYEVQKIEQKQHQHHQHR